MSSLRAGAPGRLGRTGRRDAGFAAHQAGSKSLPVEHCKPAVRRASLHQSTYQATQLEASQELQGFDLVPSIPHCDEQHSSSALHQLHHVFLSRGSDSAQHVQTLHPRSQPTAESSASEHDLDAVDGQALLEQLFAARDAQELDLLIQLYADQLQQRHARVALLRVIQLARQIQSQDGASWHAADHQRSSQLCVARLCHCWLPSDPATRSAQRSRWAMAPLSSWGDDELLLLARAMAVCGWCSADVWQPLCAIVLEGVGTLAPRHASTLLWATAKLRQRYTNGPIAAYPDASQLTQLMERVWAGAGRLQPESIAQAFYACGLLRLMPSQRCVEGLLRMGLTQRLQEWQGSDLACVMWSLATLRYPVTSDTLDAVITQSERAMRSFSAGPALASMLWAFATLRQAPPKGWMEHYLWQVQRRSKTCDPHTLSVIFWSLAKLRYRPPTAWAAAMLRVAGQRMFAPGRSDSDSAQASSSDSEAEQQSAVQQPAAPAARQQLEPMVLWPPDMPRDHAAAQHSQSHLPFDEPLSGASLQGTFPATAQAAHSTHATPAQPATATPHVAREPPRTERRGAGASPAVFSKFVWALARLQVLPRASFLGKMCASMEPALSDFRASDIAITLWSLQRLRYEPEPEWMAAACWRLQSQLRSAGLLEVLTALTALAGYAPVYKAQEPVLSALFLYVGDSLPGMGPSHLAVACSAFGQLCSSRGVPQGCMPVLASLIAAVRERLPAMTSKELTNCVLGLSHLVSSLPGSEQWTQVADLVAQATLSVRPRMAECTYADLVQLAVACSLVGHAPSRDWLAAHEAAACQFVSRARVTSTELRPLLDAYALLNHRPYRLASAAEQCAARAASHRLSGRDTPVPGAQHSASGQAPMPPAAALPSQPQLSPEQYRQLRQSLQVNEQPDHDSMTDPGVSVGAGHDTAASAVRGAVEQQGGRSRLFDVPVRGSQRLRPPALRVKLRAVPGHEAAVAHHDSEHVDGQAPLSHVDHGAATMDAHAAAHPQAVSEPLVAGKEEHVRSLPAQGPERRKISVTKPLTYRQRTRRCLHRDIMRPGTSSGLPH